jgi:hypothetical protein
MMPARQYATHTGSPRHSDSDSERAPVSAAKANVIAQLKPLMQPCLDRTVALEALIPFWTRNKGEDEARQIIEERQRQLLVDEKYEKLRDGFFCFQSGCGDCPQIICWDEAAEMLQQVSTKFLTMSRDTGNVQPVLKKIECFHNNRPCETDDNSDEEIEQVRERQRKWSDGADEFERELQRLHTNDPDLKRLDLDGKGCGDEGAAQMAEALRDNTVLTELRLSRNSIGTKGAAKLAEALHVNTALKLLDLSLNSIGHEGDEGTVKLAGALHVNTVLESLDLSDNRIGFWSDEGEAKLAEVMQINTILTMLQHRPCKNDVYKDVIQVACASNRARRDVKQAQREEQRAEDERRMAADYVRIAGAVDADGSTPDEGDYCYYGDYAKTGAVANGRAVYAKVGDADMGMWYENAFTIHSKRVVNGFFGTVSDQTHRVYDTAKGYWRCGNMKNVGTTTGYAFVSALASASSPELAAGDVWTVLVGEKWVKQAAVAAAAVSEDVVEAERPRFQARRQHSEAMLAELQIAGVHSTDITLDKLQERLYEKGGLHVNTLLRRQLEIFKKQQVEAKLQAKRNQVWLAVVVGFLAVFFGSGFGFWLWHFFWGCVRWLLDWAAVLFLAMPVGVGIIYLIVCWWCA